MALDHGEGSIYKSKKHGWVASYKNPKTGKRKYFYGKTEAQVKRALKEYKKFSEVVDEDTTSQDVKSFFNDWLERDLKNSLKPKSYDVKDYVIKQFIIPNLGNIQVGQIQSKDVQKLIRDMTDKGYSYSTIKKVYDTINQRFKKAIDQRELIFNPTSGVTLPKKIEHSKSDIRFFSEEELKDILAAAESKYPNGTYHYRLGFGIRFLAYTGLRIGEALALTWNDIDFASNKIKINKNIVTIVNRGEGKGIKRLVQDSPKTSSGFRTIPLSKCAKIALVEISKVQNVDIENLSDEQKKQYILSTESGLPAEPRNFARMFARIQERAGIKEKGTLHSLRHTFATRLIQVGTDIKVVSKLLGHSDVNITYNTYVHVIEEAQAKAVENIDLI